MSGIHAWAFEAFADIEIEWLHGDLLFEDTREEMTRDRQRRAHNFSLLEFKERE
nr:hypothetical protein FFPRI1PSEUD_23990 [Pseudomonas sp. FFPRI_1]